jgi:hypothetical protein
MAYKKGESGNPNGRPMKGNSYKDIAEELLNKKVHLDPEDGETRVSKKELLLRLQIEAAEKMIKPQVNEKTGNVTCDDKILMNVLDRIEGKPTQKIEQKVEDTRNETIDKIDEYMEYEKKKLDKKQK